VGAYRNIIARPSLRRVVSFSSQIAEKDPH
jgi:hypothetical protein